VVKIPGDWIKDSHNFQLEKVDLTVVPQVFGKVPCSCETKRIRPKKNKKGPMPAPKKYIG